jgi:hypothetical protein
MKKVLFGTTALVGAALLAGAAHAESPKVTVGGFLDFQAGWLMNSENDAGNRNYGFRNDTEVSFKIDGVADSGLKYGGEISLEADVDGPGSGYSDADYQGVNASKTYLYLEGGWGRVELGSNIGADQTLKIDASSIARASGGIDGAFTYFNPGGTGTGTVGYLVTPDLLMNYGNITSAQGTEDTENANKITYYTPRYAGFQAGISYAPDQTDRGQLMTRTDRGTGTGAGGTPSIYGNILQGGVSYDTTYNGWGIGLAGTGEWANADTSVYKDLRAWQGGAKLSYLGFSLAGSYADMNGSGLTKATGGDTTFWTAGAAYEWGPFGVSATYLQSKVDTNVDDHKFRNIALGADWKLAPGFTPYVEADFFKYDANATADVDGTVLIVGSQLAF